MSDRTETPTPPESGEAPIYAVAAVRTDGHPFAFARPFSDDGASWVAYDTNGQIASGGTAQAALSVWSGRTYYGGTVDLVSRSAYLAERERAERAEAERDTLWTEMEAATVRYDALLAEATRLRAELAGNRSLTSEMTRILETYPQSDDARAVCPDPDTLRHGDDL